MKLSKSKATLIIVSCIIVVVIIASAVVLPIIFKDGQLNDYSFFWHGDKDSIHFLNTGHSDCIIISSRGEYALIDCGYSQNNLSIGESPAMNTLVPYLKKLSDNKEINFKYAIATHTHVDHLSGFLDLAEQDFVHIEEFLIKKFNGTGNRRLYNQVIKLFEDKQIPINHQTENALLHVGNFTLQILNGQLEKPTYHGDNENSLAILVTRGNQKALLAGDLCNYSGDEDNVAKIVEKIDLLKVAHHAHYGSTPESFMSVVQPQYAVVTNTKFPSKTVKERLIKYCKNKVYTTEQSNGIVAVFGGKIRLYKNSCNFSEQQSN